MKEAVVTVFRKDSDNVDVQSKGSTGWFNLDHEFFLINISTLEPDFYKKLYENILKVYTWNRIKPFLPFHYN